MKKNVLFVFMLVSIFWSQFSFAEDAVSNSNDEGVKVINKIEVEGNNYIKRKTILSAIKSKKGDFFFDSTVKADVQKIYDLGYFEDVTVDVEDITAENGAAAVVIKFLVKEKPKVEKILFVGNKNFSTSTLKSEIESKTGENLDNTTLLSDAEKVKNKYHEKGYADVKVEYFVKESEKKKNYVVLTFYVTEGNKILIKGVDIKGLKQFSQKKIKKQMKTRIKKVFKQEVLDQDILTIIEFYKNRGYLNVAITKPTVSYNEERTGIFIEFEIDEGQRYKVNSVDFSGNTVYTTDELKKSVTIKISKLFNEETFRETIANIQELYANKGYLRAELNPQKLTNEELATVDIVFEIKENEVVYVDKIYIDGNVTTKEKVIRREVVIQEGEPFSATKVRRSIEKIMNLGFMDDVQIDIQQPKSIDKADLVFNVTEGKPGVLSAGVGFSNVDKVLGNISVSHVNMFGRAQKLNLSWEFGERKQSYDISFTEPWFMDKPVSVGVNVFDTTRKRQYGDESTAYQERRRGGGLEVGPRFSDIYSAYFSYSYENIRVFDIDQDLAGEISPSDDVTSSLTPQLVRDTRDNVFDPTIGSHNRIAVQVAGGPFGGDVNFYKPTFKSSWFFPTFWKFVFSVNADLAAIRHFNPSSDIPIYERFYVGGADSLRGYDYRGQIGPFDGGKVMSVFNIEYKFPIVQEKRKTILQGAFFCDVGNSWLSMKDVNFNIGTPEKWMKAGVGFGIRFKTPVFPIRLDWGYGLNHKPGETLSQFHFTLGNVF